jgi:hypothetical protein
MAYIDEEILTALLAYTWLQRKRIHPSKGGYAMLPIPFKFGWEKIPDGLQTISKRETMATCVVSLRGSVAVSAAMRGYRTNDRARQP